MCKWEVQKQVSKHVRCGAVGGKSKNKILKLVCLALTGEFHTERKSVNSGYTGIGAV